MIRYKRIKKLIEENSTNPVHSKVKAKKQYDHKLDYVPAKKANVILNIKDLVKTFNPKFTLPNAPWPINLPYL